VSKFRFKAEDFKGKGFLVPIDGGTGIFETLAEICNSRLEAEEKKAQMVSKMKTTDWFISGRYTPAELNGITHTALLWNIEPIGETEGERMSWQTCPHCSGTGIGLPRPWSGDAAPRCNVCNGKKIIHVVTGKPPSE
jgi:hypothetical protein